ncbi:MAG TPA: immunoglobulin domain-containing protein, partial [Saprospiraceae bacterium]|nr:immunoglobulin domain-containing protein [Saprospiraceae bacterium]
SVCEGNTLTITIAAQAAYGGSLSYQWIKDGNQISGATSATYVKTSVTTADEGNYKCLVAESSGKMMESSIVEN